MLSTKEQQEKVRANFKNILDAHDKEGQPVVIFEGDKTFHFYKDGRKIDITKNKKKDIQTSFSF